MAASCISAVSKAFLSEADSSSILLILGSSLELSPVASDGVLERGGPLGNEPCTTSVAAPLDLELALAMVHSSGGVYACSAMALGPPPVSLLDLRLMAGDSPVLCAEASGLPHGSGSPGGGADRLTEADLDEADRKSKYPGSPLLGEFTTTWLGVRASWDFAVCRASNWSSCSSALGALTFPGMPRLGVRGGVYDFDLLVGPKVAVDERDAPESDAGARAVSLVHACTSRIGSAIFSDTSLRLITSGSGC